MRTLFKLIGDNFFIKRRINMTNRDVFDEIERMGQELATLKAQITNLERNMNELFKAQSSHQPTSLQEQQAQAIMARSAHPDESSNQYSGR
jgi:regulator of replication initiation timing